jgi:hypothetical protein
VYSVVRAPDESWDELIRDMTATNSNALQRHYGGTFLYARPRACVATRLRSCQAESGPIAATAGPLLTNDPLIARAPTVTTLW